MRIVITIILLIFLSSCNKDNSFIPETLTNNPGISLLDKSVQEIFDKNKDDLNSVGLIIGIYKDGQNNYYGYGEKIMDDGVPPDEFTYFEIGSISKTFTSISTKIMLNENNLTIEESVRSFLPNDLPVLGRNEEEVKFKHLLTHTSGLPFMPDNMGLQVYVGRIGEAFEKYSREKLFTCLYNMSLEADPFTRFKYSNLGYGVLGTILEMEYDQDYSDVIKSSILSPLNMSETSAIFSETEETRWTKPYVNGKETKYWKDFNALAGAGELKSNASDMMKYLVGNIYPPENSLGEAITETHQLTYETKVETSNFDYAPALGWFIYEHHDIPGETFLFHNGGTGGYNTDLFVNKDKESGLLIMYNTVGATMGREKFTRGLLELISE